MEVRAFTKRQITENTWVIEGVGCLSYLLIGEKCAMMIDAGQSTLNLKAYVEKITDKPITGVINTHGHFDHTGGNAWFGIAYMHPEAVVDAKDIFYGLDESLYSVDYEIETIKEGKTFDLGGRTLEIIEIPAHNKGSIAILDHENRLIFTGDELESGQVLLMFIDEGESKTQFVEKHQKNMKKLKAREDEYDMILPAHNGTPIYKGYVDRFIECDQMIMDGIEGDKEIHSPTMNFPGTSTLRRLEYNGANIVYDIRYIFENK